MYFWDWCLNLIKHFLMGVSCSHEFVMSICWKPFQTATFNTKHSRVLVPSLCRWVICWRGFSWLALLAMLLVLDQLLMLALPEPLCLPFHVVSRTVQDQHLYEERHIRGSVFGSTWRQSQLERANTYAKELHIKRYWELFLGAQLRDALL